MWNFVGRQNDLQGNYESLEGNWLSGISFIDNLHLDNQNELTTDMKNNKGRNTYFFLPFILAIIGMVYHAQKEWKSFYVLLLLFLFTGLVLKIYLNERPFEPRERDYALVGSFYIFAMWIGVGIYAIYQYILKYVSPKVALPAVLATTLLASPVLLASENWDDHDRSGKYTAVAMAKAYLDSCEPNAILFTIGDNDTFPMWYLQEIEGYRTDVRIINTSLLATDWYIDEMKVKSNKSDAVPISFTHDQYVGDKRNYCLFDERTTDTLDLGLTLDFLKDDRSKREMKNGQFVHFYPSEHLKVKIDKQNIIKNKVVDKKYYDSIVPQINLKLKGGAIYKNRILMLDIFNENNWKRPIYFSPGSFGADDYIWMKEYLQLDGMVYKLVPIRTKLQEGNPYDMGYIDTEKTYKIINQWTWGNAGSDKIYHDPETRRNALSYRNNLSRLMTALIEEKKFDKAQKVIEIAMKNMPIDYFEYYYTVEPFAEGYYKIGKKEEARKILNQLIKKYQEKLTFFHSQSEKQKAFYRREIYREIDIYRSLLLLAQENGDIEFYNLQRVKFNNFNNMMGEYKREIE
jgi:tetratricopeptide (TPR) repeat protein